MRSRRWSTELGRAATLRLADALYVELSVATDLVLLTTDQRLGRVWSAADTIRLETGGCVGG